MAEVVAPRDAGSPKTGGPGADGGQNGSDARRGMLLLLLAVTLFPIMDSIAKELAKHLPVLQITWGRYAFTVALILPIVLWRHRAAFCIIPSPGLQLARGLAQLAGTFLFFLTLTHLPLADTVALAFLYPLVITLLSPLVLGERIGWRRHLAVAIGFLGALVIIRPGPGLVQPAALLGLGISVASAIYLLITRRIRGRAPPLVSLVYASTVSLALSTLPLAWIWQPMAAFDWLAFLVIGALGAACHGLLIQAFESAPASVLAPLGYAEIVMAVIVGYAWFGDFPDPVTWLGIAIIAATGLYVASRERRAG